jgi:hypothetical protein
LSNLISTLSYSNAERQIAPSTTNTTSPAHHVSGNNSLLQQKPTIRLSLACWHPFAVSVIDTRTCRNSLVYFFTVTLVFGGPMTAIINFTFTVKLLQLVYQNNKLGVRHFNPYKFQPEIVKIRSLRRGLSERQNISSRVSMVTVTNFHFQSVTVNPKTVSKNI